MAVFTVTTFASFASLLLAARKLATGPDPIDGIRALADLAANGTALAAALGASGLAPLGQEMEARASEADAAFDREGAAEEARTIFWQVAPAALADPAVMAAGGLDAEATTDHMVVAIKASAHGDDFTRTPMAEAYFRAVARPTLAAMLAKADFIATITPDLWRRALGDHGVQITYLDRIDTTTQRIEAKVDALPDTIVAKLMEEFRRTGEAEAARAADLSDERILGLARRVAENVPDLEHAFAELEHLVEVAIEVQARGHAGSNTDDFVAAVLARIAALSAEGRDDDAAAEADRAFAEWEERQRLEAQKGIALLEAGIRADILRRDPESAARRIIRKIDIEAPDRSAAFAALWQEMKDRYALASRRGGMMELEVLVFLGRERVNRAVGPIQAGAALNDLGAAYQNLGERHRSAQEMELAAQAFREALIVRPRAGSPIEWVMTKRNLGLVLTALGEWTGDASVLRDAISAFEATLEVLTPERQPLDWAKTQNGLGAALGTLGRLEDPHRNLLASAAAFRAAVDMLERVGSSDARGTALMGLGSSLATFGEMKRDVTYLNQAIAAFEAAKAYVSESNNTIEWSILWNGIGRSLQTVGEIQRSPAVLREAVLALEEALSVRSREQTPVDWAISFGNQGVALCSLAELESSAEVAKRGVQQIAAAETVARAAGHAQFADYCAWLLPRAEALVRKLAG